MRKLLIALVASICLWPLLAGAQDVPIRTRIVVQVSDADPAKWTLALNNVKNVQEELGADKVDIEIVAYGPGIGMLRFDAPTNSRITEVVKSGVAVVACENTMRAQKISLADMHPGLRYARAGVVQIVRRQQEGWAYVRP